jgi:hypothetical protein
LADVAMQAQREVSAALQWVAVVASLVVLPVLPFALESSMVFCLTACYVCAFSLLNCSSNIRFISLSMPWYFAFS